MSAIKKAKHNLALISSENYLERCRISLPASKMNHIYLTVALLAATCVGSLQAADVNICAGVKSQMFLPYLGNCSRYYVCMNEFPIQRECEVGYLFDAKNQTCGRPSDVTCVQNCTSALSSFCYDRTCTKYVLCYAGTPVVRECCDGLQYNSETDRCDYPQYVDCQDNLCTIFNDPTNITFLSSKATCEKYYVCMDGEAFNQTCANGLQFNTECNCCDFPSRANCTITTAVKRNIMPFSKAPPKRADIDCPVEGATFLAHARSDSYYYCLNGRGVVLECTPGLVYDSVLETCREPQYVE